MTWIDERLFGWTRSAKRGTSAWSGFSGDEVSRVGTPDDTDDEDTGDYDNVAGIVNAADDQLSAGHTSRSRQSSYADLQRLRITPTSQTIPVPEATSRFTHRARRESLSDGVPVKRLAALDREEQFCDATHDINIEIQQAKAPKSD